MSPKAEPPKNTFSDKTTQDPKEHMEAMGAPKGKGQFSAMPPSQHRAFLDISQSQENRVLAAIWERVIVPNAQDWTLASFARESNERKTPTGVKDLSNATGINEGNVSKTLKLLEERGIVQIEKKPFRIYLCYYVPKPTIDIRQGKKEQTNVLCTRACNARQLRYLERLQQDTPETFRAAISRLVGQKLYDLKRDADATAWSRERGAEQWEQRFTEIGYTEKETRGRERIRPASDPERFKPAQTFEEFYVQNEAEITELAAPLSVRNGEILVNTIHKNSEQNPHPYGLTPHSLTQEELASQGRSNAKTTAREAELATKAARTEIKAEINAIHERVGLCKMGASLLAARTQDNIAAEIVKLAVTVPPAQNALIHQIYGLVEDKCSAYKRDKVKPDNWDKYLYTVVKEEVAKLLKKIDLNEQINEAAREKSGWAKSAKAGRG